MSSRPSVKKEDAAAALRAIASGSNGKTLIAWMLQELGYGKPSWSTDQRKSDRAAVLKDFADELVEMLEK